MILPGANNIPPWLKLSTEISKTRRYLLFYVFEFFFPWLCLILSKTTVKRRGFAYVHVILFSSFSLLQ